MARITFKDQAYIAPDGEVRGEDLMDALKVSPGHSLVAIGRDGNRLVHRDDRVRLLDGDYFVDAPTFKFGATVE